MTHNTDAPSPDADGGGISPKLSAKMARFSAVHAEWLAARADLAAKHEDESEAAEARRYERARGRIGARYDAGSPFIRHLAEMGVSGFPDDR